MFFNNFYYNTSYDKEQSKDMHFGRSELLMAL